MGSNDNGTKQNTALQGLKKVANSEEQIKHSIRNTQNMIKHLDDSYKERDVKINETSLATDILQADKTSLQLKVNQLKYETKIEYDEKVKQLEQIRLERMKIDKSIMYLRTRFDNKLKELGKTHKCVLEYNRCQISPKPFETALEENKELLHYEGEVAEINKEIDRAELKLKQLNEMNEQEKKKILQKETELLKLK